MPIFHHNNFQSQLLLDALASLEESLSNMNSNFRLATVGKKRVCYHFFGELKEVLKNGSHRKILLGGVPLYPLEQEFFRDSRFLTLPQAFESFLDAVCEERSIVSDLMLVVHKQSKTLSESLIDPRASKTLVTLKWDSAIWKNLDC